jgi:hypothetical protein
MRSRTYNWIERSIKKQTKCEFCEKVVLEGEVARIRHFKDGWLVCHLECFEMIRRD